MKSEKVVFLFSCLIAVYFVLFALNTFIFHYSFVLIGVVQELVRIPCMLGQLALLVLSGKAFVSGNYKFKSYAFVSLLMMLTTSLLTWGSFFVYN